ncbi:MAG: pirin family protein [Bacteroidetes bacterium]|nr:pirin family protein [Bacteroidota bacterium]
MIEKVIKRVVKGQQVSDGAGVSLNRLIANSKVNNIDPFFLLDEFRSKNPDDYIAGFPMHPHRGIETITYIIEGSFKHKDSRDGGGLLKSGDVQWMTAGKGIQHEEMPAMEKGHLWGYQLWLNLPKKMKWLEPKYQYLSKGKIPVIKKEGVKIIVISGSIEGINGPAQNSVPSEYYDVYLRKGKKIKLNAKKDFNSLVYIHSGRVKIQNEDFEKGELIEFVEDKEINIESVSVDSGFLFLSAKPNKEPYARGGPFVMNTREEIIQAFDDYEKGKLF